MLRRSIVCTVLAGSSLLAASVVGSGRLAAAADLAPPEVGEVVFEDPLSQPGAVTDPWVCSTGRGSRQFVEDGYLLRARGRCDETAPYAGLGFGVPGLRIADGEARVEVRIVTGFERVRVRLYIRSQADNTSGYYATVVPSQGYVDFLRIQRGQPAMLGQRTGFDLGFDPTGWNSLAVRAQGQTLWFLVNEQPVLSTVDASFDLGSTLVTLQRTGNLESDEEAAIVARNLRVAGLAGGDVARLPTYAPGQPAAPAAAPPSESPSAPPTADGTPPTTGRNVRLSENFDMPGVERFPRSSTLAGTSVGRTDGEYMMRWDAPRGGFHALPAGFRYFDAGVGVEARLVDEAPGGIVLLMCRGQSGVALSGYAFGVQPATGLVALGRFDGGEYLALADWQPSEAVRRGSASNQLELDCSGQSITASVNGSLVASAREERYGGGWVAIGVGSAGGPMLLEARFDNFVVWESPPPGRPGRMVEDEGFNHAPEGEPIQYRHNPPSSGTHYASSTPPGIYAEPQPAGSWVHSLEHGYVVVLYNCPTDCPELVGQLRQFYEAAPKSARHGRQKLIVQPYREMDHRLAIVAWDYIDEMDELDAERLRAFYRAYHDHGPEDVP
jgi:hypothetical protein